MNFYCKRYAFLLARYVPLQIQPPLTSVFAYFVCSPLTLNGPTDNVKAPCCARNVLRQAYTMLDKDCRLWF